MAVRPRVKTLLVDLDGTLYDIRNGYEEHVRQNVFRFMVERLGISDVNTAKVLWREHFKEYNQSLLALRAGAGFQFDTEEYWDFIRAGAGSFLKPDPALRQLLETLPQRKWVFTNCNEKHGRIALELLGLQGCFQGVIGADTMGNEAKPSPAAFHRAFAAAGVDSPGHQVAMFEDSLKNLRTAKSLGLTTLLVGSATAAEEGAAPGEGLIPKQGVESSNATEGASTANGRVGSDSDQGLGNKCMADAGGGGCLDGAVTALTEAELRRAMPYLWDR